MFFSFEPFVFQIRPQILYSSHSPPLPHSTFPSSIFQGYVRWVPSWVSRGERDTDLPSQLASRLPLLIDAFCVPRHYPQNAKIRPCWTSTSELRRYNVDPLHGRTTRSVRVYIRCVWITQILVSIIVPTTTSTVCGVSLDHGECVFLLQQYFFFVHQINFIFALLVSLPH